MYVVALVCIWSTTYHEYSFSQLVLVKQPNISNLRTFGCVVYVPIAPTQHTKMGPQWRLRIIVSFDSSSIIRYLKYLTDNVFTSRFVNCHFNQCFSCHYGEKIRFLNNDEKLLGMHLLGSIFILVQINVN